MAKVCTICRHPERAAIEADLVAQKPLRDIASQRGVSRPALARHRRAHLPKALVQAKQAAEVAQADDLLAQLRALQAKTLDLLGQAESAGDLRTALVAIREARGCLELLAELSHELDRRPQFNILLSQEWIAIRTTMMEALQPFPEARITVAAALEELGKRM